MKQEKIQELIRNYPAYTDKYFLRTKQILEAEKINPTVRYQVFARQNIERLTGVNEAVDFIKQTSPNAKIYALKDGMGYKANTPLIKIEGKVQELVDLETVYLGILSGNFTGPLDLNEMREKARAIKKAAEDKTLLYFGARHFDPFLDEKIAKICQEEGFAGCSTDIGAKAWNAKGGGTTPHALFLTYKAYMNENNLKGNPTVEAAKAFDKNMNPNIPRVILNCTFKREMEDTFETAKTVPAFKACRIDTCGENYAQGANQIVLPELIVPEKYKYGKGVKIASVWALRRGLDKAGQGDLEIAISSGFNAEKTTAFMQADKEYQKLYNKPLFTAIGTGSIAKPIMTTSDICAYFNESEQVWKPMSKVGRKELPNGRLEEVAK